MKDISRRIRSLRKELGLTQRQLGAKAGMVHSTICAFETGIKNPGASSLIRLADAFNVSIDFIVLGKGVKVRECFGCIRIKNDIKELSNKIEEEYHEQTHPIN